MKSAGAVRGYSKFIFSPEAVAAYSAIIATPIFARVVIPLINRVPFLSSHRVITLLVAAIIVFVIATKLGGLLRSICLGAAAGLTINAFQASGAGQSILGRINGIAGGQ